MMFWLGFFVGIGAASLFALLILAAMSCAPTSDDAADLYAQEAGR